MQIRQTLSLLVLENVCLICTGVSVPYSLASHPVSRPQIARILGIQKFPSRHLWSRIKDITKNQTSFHQAYLLP